MTFFLITRNKAAVLSKSNAIEEHRALLEALVARDPERLVTLTDNHLLSAYERLASAMKDSQPAST